MIGGLDVDRSAEAKFANMYINIKKGDMGGADGPSTSDRVARV